MKWNSIFILAGLFVGVGVAVEMPTGDTVTGAKDHPLLSRFAGSKLVGYNMKEFEEVVLPAGKVVRDKVGKEELEKTQKLEGKLTRIVYNYPVERSSLEVMRNYQAAIQKAGLKIVFSCDNDGCGPSFGDRMLEGINVNSLKLGSEYWASFNNGRVAPRYLLATGTRSDGSVAYAAVYIVAPTDDKLGGVYLQIVEPKAMETDKVAVNLNADDMAKGLASEGKIALYGIYFDTDKAEIKAESKPQLAEMAKLLQKNSTLKVYIVGHTDNQGAVARNVTLSQQRSEAVVKALVSEHKIDAKRLAPKGVASYAPVAANGSDAGRAKNRRVELVQQ